MMVALIRFQILDEMFNSSLARSLVTPCWSLGLKIVQISSNVCAEPSWRYGALLTTLVSSGVSISGERSVAYRCRHRRRADWCSICGMANETLRPFGNRRAVFAVVRRKIALRAPAPASILHRERDSDWGAAE